MGYLEQWRRKESGFSGDSSWKCDTFLKFIQGRVKIPISTNSLYHRVISSIFHQGDECLPRNVGHIGRYFKHPIINEKR